MAINTDDLIERAKCVDACIPKEMQMAVLISLMAQLAGDAPIAPITIGTPTLAYDRTDGPLIYVFNITQGNPSTPTDSSYAWNLQGSPDNVTWYDIVATQLITGPGPDEISSPAYTGAPADGPYFRVRWQNLTTSEFGTPSNVVQQP